MLVCLILKNEVSTDYSHNTNSAPIFNPFRRTNNVSHKDLEQLTTKLVSYILRVRRLRIINNYAPSYIIAMDETSVQYNMVSKSTIDVRGVKVVPMKSTGHEKANVSVCLSARADGTKLKPMIVFKDAKQDVNAIHKKMKGKAVVASSSNGWMNTDLTLRYINEIIGSFSFKPRMLAWDTFSCHLKYEVKKSLKDKKIDVAYIPGGTTGFIQAPDVSWNKVRGHLINTKRFVYPFFTRPPARPPATPPPYMV